MWSAFQESPEDVIVSVSDQGVGIAPDKLERLFEPFYRVQDAATRSVEGLGLGLALTRTIVEAHGGKIWAESEPGRGSVFSVSIPKQDSGIERTASLG